MPRRKHAKKRARKPKATGRHTAEEKAEILAQVDAGRTQVEVADQYGVHPVTLSRWMQRRKAARKTGQKSDGLEPHSTRPHHSPSAVSCEERDLILKIKAEHPEMGPAQIRNQLRRFDGVSHSHKVIGKVLRDAGYKLEKRVGDEEEKVVERFEMSRPNELWTMDIKEFYIHDLKVYLVDMIDDYSRFVVGHGLFRESTSDHVLEVFRNAMVRHGKPERVLTDRGREFHVWGKGLSPFTRFLETEMVEHSLARPHHPQTCGKIEAVHGTLQKELLGRVRFDSFSHAQREIARYFESYNHERTHMGIGGVTPADRYFGRLEKVQAELEQRTPSIDREGASGRYPGERAVVLQLALVEGELELWFAGKRTVLG